MSSKDRLWDRLPRFIWGRGSVGLEDEPDQMTGTLHLTHTRHPRFVCTYDIADEDIDGVEMLGSGARVSIHANDLRFRDFVFIDPPSSMEDVQQVCLMAALCREDLADELDDGTQEDDVGRAQRYLADHPDHVKHALPEFFPKGWRAEWTREQRGDAVVLIHRRGYEVVFDGVSNFDYTGLLPGRRMIARIKAQCGRLINDAPLDLLVAHELAQAADHEEEVAATIAGLCPECQPFFDRFMTANFPAGWRAHWAVEEGGLLARRDDGYRMQVRAATGDGAPITGGAELILFRGEVEIGRKDEAPADREARIASTQAGSLLLEIAPEELGLGNTLHHGTPDPQWGDASDDAPESRRRARRTMRPRHSISTRRG